jgi:hypothetical protein
MTTDRYTKTVLTVIAIALSVIALRMSFSDSARAMGDGCGDRINPCYIEYRALAPSTGLRVEVTNWP